MIYQKKSYMLTFIIGLAFGSPTQVKAAFKDKNTDPITKFSRLINNAIQTLKSKGTTVAMQDNSYNSLQPVVEILVENTVLDDIQGELDGLDDDQQEDLAKNIFAYLQRTQQAQGSKDFPEYKKNITETFKPNIEQARREAYERATEERDTMENRKALNAFVRERGFDLDLDNKEQLLQDLKGQFRIFDQDPTLGGKAQLRRAVVACSRFQAQTDNQIRAILDDYYNWVAQGRPLVTEQPSSTTHPAAQVRPQSPTPQVQPIAPTQQPTPKKQKPALPPKPKKGESQPAPTEQDYDSVMVDALDDYYNSIVQERPSHPAAAAEEEEIIMFGLPAGDRLESFITYLETEVRPFVEHQNYAHLFSFDRLAQELKETYGAQGTNEVLFHELMRYFDLEQ